MAAEPLTELEMAIETVVTTFFNFAGREGRKGSLSINEFKELVTQQLPYLLKVGGISGPEILRVSDCGTLCICQVVTGHYKVTTAALWTKVW